MFKTIIGLEIHVQLNTKSKMFCGCLNSPRIAHESGGRITRKSVSAGTPSPDGWEEPNTRVCPVCMGFPGTLPVANVEAIKKTIKTGLALNCIIPKESKFDRKHYFYPDLPKNFQISQYDMPFCRNGKMEIPNPPPAVAKRQLWRAGKSQIPNKIKINRVHLEEDAGKLIHPAGVGYTLVDLNRSGTPLMEVVTEPDINSPELAKDFLKELRLIIRYLGVSDADMEKGQLRCDANISIQQTASSKQLKAGSRKPAASAGVLEAGVETTPIIEIKNMNSFRAVERALTFEEKRLRENFAELKKEKGKQTRAWVEKNQATKSVRRKEEASDYRYFPEPDIPTIKTTNLVEIKKTIPELPQERRIRYQEMGLSGKAAEAIIAKKAYSDYFDEAVRAGGEPHKIYDLMINEKAGTIIGLKQLNQAIKLVSKGAISQKMLKEILPELKKGLSALEIIEKKDIKQVSDESELKGIIEKIIKQNLQAVESYKKGKKEALGFLVGQVMRETKGQANPVLTNKLLAEMLK